MCRIIPGSLLLGSIFFFHDGNAFTQIVGSNCFLPGMYVEMGINSCGAYGSSASPPAGYYYNTYPGIGFTADAGDDGWTTSYPPYCGDYFEPGSPVEGWSFELGAAAFYNSDDDCLSNDIPGSITSYTYSGGVYTATWEGDLITGSYNFHITQETSIPEDKNYIVTRVTFCNNSAISISKTYYMRNVDPDQDEPWSGDFTTQNIVVANPPASDHALVTSQGLEYHCFLGLGSYDTSARASFGCFSTTDGKPKDVYQGNSICPYDGGYSLSGSNTYDCANSLAFSVGSFTPGQCKCVSFAYILNSEELDDALNATLPATFIVDGTAALSGDTVLVSSGVPTPVTVVGPGGYTWTWSPASGLSGTSGATVSATVTALQTYTVMGTGDNCTDVLATITLVPNETLPIELSSFDASCESAGIYLSWTSESEENTLYFTVQSGDDGITFRDIAEIEAAGNSNTTRYYSWTDPSTDQASYYRLMITDKDGAYHFGPIRFVSCQPGEGALQILSATTSGGNLDIHVFAAHAGTYHITVFDLNGKSVLSKVENMDAGAREFVYPFSAASGTDLFIAWINGNRGNETASLKFPASY